MMCEVKKLSKSYVYSDKCEKFIGELLYAHKLLPNPHSYSKGYEPDWDIMYSDRVKTKVEIKIQAGYEMCFELSKRKTGESCGVKTTEAIMYFMINLVRVSDTKHIGMLRLIYTEDILRYIDKMGNKLRTIPCYNENITFISPDEIEHINLGYFPSLNYGQIYDLSNFTVL